MANSARFPPGTLGGAKRNGLGKNFEILFKSFTSRQQSLRQHRTKPAICALHASCLHIFRHLAQVFLNGYRPAGIELVLSDEKYDGAICAHALYGAALTERFFDG